MNLESGLQSVDAGCTTLTLSTGHQASLARPHQCRSQLDPLCKLAIIVKRITIASTRGPPVNLPCYSGTWSQGVSEQTVKRPSAFVPVEQTTTRLHSMGKTATQRRHQPCSKRWKSVRASTFAKQGVYWPRAIQRGARFETRVCGPLQEPTNHQRLDCFSMR